MSDFITLLKGLFRAGGIQLKLLINKLSPRAEVEQSLPVDRRPYALGFALRKAENLCDLILINRSYSLSSNPIMRESDYYR